MSRSRTNSITAVTASGRAVRGVLSRSGSMNVDSTPAKDAPKNLGERMSAAVIGVKGSHLKEGTKMQEVEENPMARLKLLLVRVPVQRGFRVAHLLFLDCFVPHTPSPQLHHPPHTHFECPSSPSPSPCRGACPLACCRHHQPGNC